MTAITFNCLFQQAGTLITAAFIAGIFTGCASPVATLQHQADAANLKKVVLPAGDQNLVSYISPQLPQLQQYHVYVFLEGDGRPWTNHRGPNNDPNTHHSVVLPLLTQHQGGGIYLARPCYAHTVMPETCDTSAWTDKRYSAATVSAMSDALTTLKQQLNIRRYVLVGHSGGGTLAMLIAAKRDDVVAVVTLAGNLDHAAWTQHFGYLPLTGSENPALQPPLPDSILRWHIIASNDKTIPPSISKKAVEHDPLASLFIIPDTDHRCCWQSVWQNILPSLEEILAQRYE